MHFSEAEARRQGLTPQQHQLLLAVQAARGAAWATVGSLSDFLQLTQHSVVGLVNRAAIMRLVRRQASIDDHRVTEVHLTCQGREVRDQLTMVHRQELLALSQEIHELSDALQAEEMEPGGEQDGFSL